MDEQALFDAALEYDDPAQQAVFLDQACGDDAELRARVELLLGVNRRLGDFLETPAWPAEQPIPSRLGDYQLVREIDHGGMGVVYEAVQISLHRRVALKILPLANMLDPRQLQRFRNEATAAASLDHPHIVTVFSVGFDQGVHFIAMQYIEGRTLAQLIEQRREMSDPQAMAATPAQAGEETENTLPLPSEDLASPEPAATGRQEAPAVPAVPRELESQRLEIPDGAAGPLENGDRRSTGKEQNQVSAQDDGSQSPFFRKLTTRGGDFFRLVAELGMQAAEALEHAHQLGVVHRDVKPSNMLVNAAGHLWITDFGVAMTQNDTGLTASGSLPGTVRYMSPEQAQGDRRMLDFHTDIYSLGATLYELLTLEPVIRATDRTAMLDEIQHQEPRPPRQLERTIPYDLETIVLRALAKRPLERYATAGELAADLRRFACGEPILARRPTRWQRCSHWCRRHRVWVTSALIALVAFLILNLISFTLALMWEQAERQRVQAALAAVEVRERHAQDLLYAADMQLANYAWHDGDARQMVELLDRYVPQPGVEDLRGFEWFLLRQLSRREHTDLLGNRDRPQGPLYFTCISPDGALLAATGAGDEIFLLSARSLQLLHVLDTGQGEVNGLAFDPTSCRLASVGDDGTLRIWDLETLQSGTPIPVHRGEAWQVVFTRDGARLITCGDDLLIRLWDAETGQALSTLQGHTAAVEAISLSADGRTLGSAGADKSARLWDLDSGAELLCLGGDEGHTGRLSSITFSPDGRWVATGGLDRTVRVWDAKTGERKTMFEHPDSVHSVAFDETGELLAAGDRGGSIRLYRYEGDWEFLSRNEIRLPPTPRPSEDSDSRSDGRGAALSVSDTSLVPPSPNTRGILLSHQGRVYRVVFGPEPGQLVSAGEDGRLICWHYQPPEIEVQFGDLGQVEDVVFVGDGSYLATAGAWGVYLIDATRGGVAKRLDERGAWLSLAISADRDLVAAAHRDGLVRVWDVSDEMNPRLRSEWSVGEPIHCHQMALSPHGEHLAIACWHQAATQAGMQTEGGVLVFDTLRGVRTHAFPAIRPECVAFAPDGLHLVGDSHNTVLVWNLATGDTTHNLSGHTTTVKAVAVSLDNRTVASAGLDRRLRLWDVDSQAPRIDIVAHPSGIQTLAFSPDGRSLVTGDQGGVLRIWQVATGRMLLEWKRPGVFVVKVAFSPQSNRLAYLSEDGRAWVIRAPR
jgi:eukaryotic-like serine/threonine-protein kinase